jgi:ribose/xylose/arabinose/galactoside ABC-type transport system permease subunit
MSPRTIFLSRLIGLYCILAGLSMAAHGQASVDMVTVLLRNPPVMFIAGLMAVLAGLAMVLGHNVCSGRVLPVVVTLSGWVALLKGALILFLTPEAESSVFPDGLQYARLLYFYTGISLILGIYLILAARDERSHQ